MEHSEEYYQKLYKISNNYNNLVKVKWRYDINAKLPVVILDDLDTVIGYIVDVIDDYQIALLDDYSINNLYSNDITILSIETEDKQ